MTTPAPVLSWVMPWGQLAWLRALDDSPSGPARRAFDTPSSYVIGGGVPGYGVSPVRMFTSFDTYCGVNTAWNGWVCYDVENWAGSPPLEKQHPKGFISAFASLAKARGHWLIAAPSRDLVYAAGADDKILPNEDINAAYLRCGIPGACAGAPVLLVQAQGAQKDLPTYRGLIAGAAGQQVPGANQALWAGLTTAFATADQMVSAYRAVAPDVAGFWVTIASQAQATVAADFFRAVL